jgi:TM2 domain-containing membrane protein YozV
MSLTTEQKIYIEQRVSNEAPSIGVAYLLWLFLGGLGAHRFYLRRVGTGLMLLFITLIGLVAWPLLVVTAIWVILDAFFIPGIVRAEKGRLRAMFASGAAAGL